MRRSTTVAVVAGLLVLAACTGTSSRSSGGSADAASLLFTVAAASGSVADADGAQEVALTGVDPNATWFTDRPQRSAGTMPTGELVQRWASLGFVADPPNAALVLHDETPEERTVVVEMTAPRFDATARRLTFVARVLDEPNEGLEFARTGSSPSLPPSFASVDLFIDDATVPTSALPGSPGTTAATSVLAAGTVAGTAGSTVGLCTFPGAVPMPVVASGGQPEVQVEGPGAIASPSAAGVAPTLAEGLTEFNTMQCSHYQHTYTESPASGLYYYDCVGFTAYALSVAAPVATASVRQALGIRVGYVPSPPLFQSFFAGLIPSATNPNPAPVAGWQGVPTAAAIAPGDILAWVTNTTTEVGHSVMALSTPVPIPVSKATTTATAAGSMAYALIVMDSTATLHGKDDTRNSTNPLSQRNAPLGSDSGTDGAPVALDAASASAPSGLGIGTIGLITDASGAVTGIVWSLGTPVEPVPFGAGHPTS